MLLSHLILCCPLLLLPLVFPRSRSFQMSQHFASGGQIIGVSALTSVLPMNTQDWSPLGLTGISLQSKGLLSIHFPTLQFKSINSSALSFLYSPTLTPIHVWKTIALTIHTFVGKVMSLFFTILSRLVITLLQGSKHSVTICSDFGAQKNKVCHCFHCLPIYFSRSDGTRCHDLSFLNVELEANFLIAFFHFHQETL